MDPGVEGMLFTVIAKVCAVLEPQVLFAITVIFPLVALAVVAILFDELVPVQPDGNVQVYEVAPLTADIEYVLLLPEQIFVGPDIVPGCKGVVFTVTARV
jgi:hypothetical protein